MDTGNIDDSTPSFLFHLRDYSFSCVETWAKVQSNDFLPHLIWELFNFADVLDSSVVDKDIHSSEIFNSLFDDVFAVSRLGQVSIYEFSFDSIFLNKFLDLFDLLLRRESI